ncbi:hypothetical protein FQN54_001150 [Arachnomyces sp. PD_36]|nr:hypothetical protein FQN54_001150 [Arachnomyces sp. PD_36]
MRPTVSPFLSLPQEVRDIIIELVLFSHRAPPESPTTPPQKRSGLKDLGVDILDSWSHGRPPVEYEEKDVVSNGQSLLLVNRQLSAETKYVLERNPSSYHLDVMFVNEWDFYPTWLSVPAFSRVVDDVVATFRMFGTHDPKHLRPGYGLPAKNIFINTLTLDFVTPPDTESLASNDQKEAWFQHRLDHHPRYPQPNPELESLYMRPEWLLEFISGYLTGLLHMGYHTAGHGGIFYERVGTIRLLVDGQLKVEYALDDLLAKLRHDDPAYTFGNLSREERLPYFWKWKKRALEMRRDAGLPVIYPKDPELEEIK